MALSESSLYASLDGSISCKQTKMTGDTLSSCLDFLGQLGRRYNALTEYTQTLRHYAIRAGTQFGSGAQDSLLNRRNLQFSTGQKGQGAYCKSRLS